MTNITVADLVTRAQSAAMIAAREYFQNVLGGRDQFPCGFAWVNVYGVKGSTKLGRALMSQGFRKSYEGGLQLWNPSGLYVQNVDALYEGAQAAARVLREHGLDAYAGSRLD